MEAIITVVGFLGAGKTTLLKHLTSSYLNKGWHPYIILNDYENAYLDSQQLTDKINPKWVKAISGSCICCTGIHQLRDFVNQVPERNKGITLIEANGTSDACALMGFLGVGIEDRFLPPIQISVADAKNWQKRGEHNELEANQIQLSSLIVLTHLENVSEARKNEVILDIRSHNPLAKIIDFAEIDAQLLPNLKPSDFEAKKLDHLKAHWASCSTDLPRLPKIESIYTICNALPESILRVKGVTQIGDEETYTFFERTPDGKISIRPFRGKEPTTGPKLLSVGLGSETEVLENAVKKGLGFAVEA